MNPVHNLLSYLYKIALSKIHLEAVKISGEVDIQFHSFQILAPHRPSHHRRKSPLYPLNRRFCGLQRQSGHFGEDKNCDSSRSVPEVRVRLQVSQYGIYGCKSGIRRVFFWKIFNILCQYLPTNSYVYHHCQLILATDVI